MNPRHLFRVAATSLMVGGCAGSQAGHLYNMKTGQESAVQMDDPRSSNGHVRATLSDGATCQGQFSEVSNENAQQVTTAPPKLTENSVASVAVMNCGPGRVLRCTLARRPWHEFSYGECQDQQGTTYALIF